MDERTSRVLAWVFGAALVALHLDFWRESEPRLIAGLLPEELAWRLAWMVGAFVYLLWLTTALWRPAAEEEPEE